MSELIMCDRCKNEYFTDSRSSKGAYIEMRIIYTGGISAMHLCKKCFKAFQVDFMKEVTSEEFDEEFGSDIPKAYRE